MLFMTSVEVSRCTPEEPLRLQDVRHGGHGLLEGVDDVAVRAPHGDEDESLERQADTRTAATGSS
jgi:hypothetical protein